MKRKQPTHTHNLSLVVSFVVVVGFLLLISATGKIFSLIKESKFDGKHRFTIAVSMPDKKAGVYSFAPDDKTISVLLFSQDKASRDTIGKRLEVPIDGVVVAARGIEGKTSSDVEKHMRSFVIGNAKTNLTIIDMFRLWWESRTVSSHAVVIEEQVAIINQDPTHTDKIVSSLFKDTTISSEKASIQVVNATGSFGVGNRLARLITNMGGNVVSVTTADEEIAVSQIAYYGEMSYTLSRLSQILGFTTTKKEKQSLSDIIIVVGKDSKDSILF